jgi:integration host factor subunit alpha
MTKADIVEKIVVLGFSKKDALQMLEMVFETMKSTLEAGEDIKISGFGNLKVRKKTPRPGRNPHTGEKITIDGRRVLTFKASDVLKNYINS